MPTTIYFVTYDLLRPGQDYDELHQRILAIDPYACRFQLSAWFLESPLSERGVNTYLGMVIDGTDMLFVSRLDNRWNSTNMPPHALQWLRARGVMVGDWSTDAAIEALNAEIASLRMLPAG